MSRPYGFTRRSTNGLHSSICMGCFRTAGQSRHSLALIGFEMTHECNPSDLVYLTDQPSPTPLRTQPKPPLDQFKRVSF